MLWRRVRRSDALLPFVNLVPGDTTLLRQAEALLTGDTDTLEQFAEFAFAN